MQRKLTILISNSKKCKKNKKDNLFKNGIICGNNTFFNPNIHRAKISVGVVFF